MKVNIFMIIDCGGGTVDLTTQKYWVISGLGEITERICKLQKKIILIKNKYVKNIV